MQTSKPRSRSTYSTVLLYYGTYHVLKVRIGPVPDVSRHHAGCKRKGDFQHRKSNQHHEKIFFLGYLYSTVPVRYPVPLLLGTTVPRVDLKAEGKKSHFASGNTDTSKHVVTPMKLTSEKILSRTQRFHNLKSIGVQYQWYPLRQLDLRTSLASYEKMLVS